MNSKIISLCGETLNGKKVDIHAKVSNEYDGWLIKSVFAIEFETNKRIELSFNEETTAEEKMMNFIHSLSEEEIEEAFIDG